MKFALVFLAVCGQHCAHPYPAAEPKLYSSFHACWVNLVPKVYYSIGGPGKWSCVQRADPAGSKPALSNVALPLSTSEVQPLLIMESGGDARLVNRFGYAGLFQFGAPLLADLGLYIPGPLEDLANWSKTGRSAPGKWSGTFDIPGFPSIRTLSDFLDSRSAQFAAFSVHRASMERQIANRGLDGYLDRQIAGMTITRAGLLYMIHLGGAGGAERVLTTHGRANPRDANGTSLLDYARLGAVLHLDSSEKRGFSDEVVAGP